MTPMLEVKDLVVEFATPGGAVRAVSGVSFSIGRAKTFALVGESGCGKSVTALSIMQLLAENARIAGGEIVVDGRNLLALKEPEKRELRGKSVSMIFQEPMTSLNPVMTVGSQIVEAIRFHEKKTSREAKTRALEMLERVQLKRQSFDEYPHRLSGGQRQRVMIAMALACGPALLIADEPTTALDVTIQEEILSLMRELRKELSMALLLITHNLAVIYRNAEDTAVMYAGKIVETAPTAALFRNPMHPYTIKLLRSTPDMEKRGKPLEAIPGVAPSPAEYPAGCRFSGRCHREMTGCAAAEPPLAEREPGHFVSCHLYDGEFMGSALSAPLMREEAVFPLHMKGAGEPLLEVKGLKVYYPIKKGILKRTIGYTKAVDGINITVRKGSTVALVGESGCGKTTAGKAIIRLIDPLEGEIAFEGKDIARLTGRELKRYRPLMQIIFQDPYSSLNPRLTAGEIIEEGLKSLKTGMTKNERAKKIASTLALVGLAPEMTARYPHEFSGGQRQRVAIARALAVEPLFIICDEATSALDVSIQAQILNLLKSIQKDLGISLLFITHDLSVVEYMADEVFVMYNGRIVERGTMDEIFLSPGDAYTRRLIDAAPRIDKG